MRLRQAVTGLSGFVRIVRVSSVWTTEPVGQGAGDRPFYNLALSGVCTIDPRELMDAIQTIERAQGRRASRRNAPRPIDIDIIWADVSWPGADPELPHPRFRSRNFVLGPLREIGFDRLDSRSHQRLQTMNGLGDAAPVGELWRLRASASAERRVAR